jgi:hypothetical protein
MDGSFGASARVAGRGRLALTGYVALAGIVWYWGSRAIRDPHYYDFGLAYTAGQLAWSMGHAEYFYIWTGTPLYAVVMGIISRVGATVGEAKVSHLLTVVNIGLVVGAVTIVLRRLRTVLSPPWWWITAAALLSFGPIMSTVWFKQVNLISLVLALGGFELVRRRRMHAGGALIGLSVAFKPLVILLPFVLVARRETRRAGAWALGYLVIVTVASQELLAAHSASVSAMNPLLVTHNFAVQASSTACMTANFAPASLLCQVTQSNQSHLWSFVACLALALLGAWVVRSLRGRQGDSWEVFAVTCAISPLLSPIEWSHYQVMLAPLFVLLVVRFTRERADRREWAGLAAAFVLASLTWRPYDTPIDVVRVGPHSLWGLSNVLFTPFTATVADVAQFGQYVLIVTGVIWYTRQRTRFASEQTSRLEGVAELVSLAPQGNLRLSWLRDRRSRHDPDTPARGAGEDRLNRGATPDRAG